MKTLWISLQDISDPAPPATLRPTLQLLADVPEIKESSRARNRRMREERRRQELGLAPEPSVFPSSVFNYRISRFRLLTTDEADMGQSLCDHGYHFINMCKWNWTSVVWYSSSENDTRDIYLMVRNSTAILYTHDTKYLFSISYILKDKFNFYPTNFPWVDDSYE